MVSWLLILLLVHNVLAVLPTRRWRGGGVVLGNKLYYYGGCQNDNIQSSIDYASSEHFYLDLSQDIVVNDAVSSWQPVPSPSKFVLEPNCGFVTAKLSETSYMMASGLGYDDKRSYLVNYTTVFYSNDNHWESIPTDSLTQDYGAAAAFDENGQVWLWGGRIVNWTNLLLPETANIHNLVIKSNTWNTVTSSLPANSFVRAEHASAFANGKIYMVGGLSPTTGNAVTGYTYTYVPLSTILVFDTVQQSWSTVTVAKGRIPSNRILHSMNYLPKSNELAIYGGMDSSTGKNNILSDFAWIYSIDQNQWRDIYSSLPAGSGAGPRYGHTAALYKNTILFVLFGVDGNNSRQDDFHILDTRNPAWITKLAAISSDNDSSYPGADDMDSDSDSNGGKTAGIAVGSIAGVAAIASGVMFFLRRKRQSTSQSSRHQKIDDFEQPNPAYPMSPPPVYNGSTLTKPHEHDLTAYSMDHSVHNVEVPTHELTQYTPNENITQHQYQKPNCIE